MPQDGGRAGEDGGAARQRQVFRAGVQRSQPNNLLLFLLPLSPLLQGLLRVSPLLPLSEVHRARQHVGGGHKVFGGVQGGTGAENLQQTGTLVNTAPVGHHLSVIVVFKKNVSH